MTPTRRPAPSDNRYILMKLRSPGASVASVPFGPAEHRLGVDDAEAVGAAEPLGDPRCHLVGLGARPVALQFEQVLQGGHGTHAGLDHALHRSLVSLRRDVAAGIRDDVALKPLIER